MTANTSTQETIGRVRQPFLGKHIASLGSGSRTLASPPYYRVAVPVDSFAPMSGMECPLTKAEPRVIRLT